MVFKLVEGAQKTWRHLDGHTQFAKDHSRCEAICQKEYWSEFPPFRTLPSSCRQCAVHRARPRRESRAAPDLRRKP
jgi:hypothetical protein